MTSEAPKNTDAEATEGFMSRWSRRKQQEEQKTSDAIAETDVSDGMQDTGTNVVVDDTTVPAQEDAADLDTAVSTIDDSEEELLTDEDMPAIDTITSNGDVSMFFNRGVSRELRKAALKHLFSLPALNITDGLNDYDEDYTTFEPLGDIVTSDMKFHAERKARLAEEEEARRLAEAEATETEDAEASTDETSAESESDAERLADGEDSEDTPDELSSNEKESADSLSEQDLSDGLKEPLAETTAETDLPLQDRTNV